MENGIKECEICREESVAGGDRKMYAAGALIIIFALYFLEFKNTMQK